MQLFRESYVKPDLKIVLTHDEAQELFDRLSRVPVDVYDGVIRELGRNLGWFGF